MPPRRVTGIYMAINTLKSDWPENCCCLNGRAKARKASLTYKTMNISMAVAILQSLYFISPLTLLRTEKVETDD